MQFRVMLDLDKIQWTVKSESLAVDKCVHCHIYLQKLLLFNTHNETKSYTYVYFVCALNFMWVCEKYSSQFRRFFWIWNQYTFHRCCKASTQHEWKICAERDAFNLCIKKYGMIHIGYQMVDFTFVFFFYFISFHFLSSKRNGNSETSTNISQPHRCAKFTEKRDDTHRICACVYAFMYVLCCAVLVLCVPSISLLPIRINNNINSSNSAIV